MPKNRHFTLEDISRLPAKAQAEVQAQLWRGVDALNRKHGYPEPTGPASTKRVASGAHPRLRQDRTGLNKTEASFLTALRAWNPGCDVGSQRVRLRLGNGAWYKPDSDVWQEDGALALYEVKGYGREAAFVRIKVAASLYPKIKFFLVTRKAGQWKIEEVLA
jgi:hypothetical protein